MNVVVEFSPPLDAMLAPDAAAGRQLRDRLWDRLARWQQDIGFPGLLQLAFAATPRPRGPGFLDVTVLADGRRCPYDRHLIVRAFETAAGRSAAAVERRVPQIREWLRHAVAEPPGEAAALRFLEDVIVEALVSSADHIVDRKLAVDVLGQLADANPDLRERLASLEPASVEAVLRELVRFPVSIGEREAMARWLVRGHEAGWSVGQIAERLFDVLRPGVIDIHMHPAALATILRDPRVPPGGQRFTVDRLDAELGDMLGLMCDGLFYEFGLYLLHVRCVADDELAETMFRFRLNDRLVGTWRGLADDEVLVNDTPERLRLLDIAGTPHANPATGAPCAVISVKDQTRAENSGLTTWAPFGYVILALSAEVRRMAPRLLSVDDVEHALARLHSIWPSFVEAVRTEMTAVQLTGVLRHLLAQGIGIRDLQSILHLVLDFRFSTGFRAPTAGWGGVEPYVYVGDADLHNEPYFTAADPYRAVFDLSPLQLGVAPPPTWIASGRMHAEFVKCGLRGALTHQVSRGQNTLICYLVDAELERRLQNSSDPSRADVEPWVDDVLAGIAQATGADLGSQMPVVFIAGTPDVALRFQDLVGEDFPEMRIVHCQTIDASANIQPIARIPERQGVTSR